MDKKDNNMPPITITKGIKNNKLVHILYTSTGKVYVPTSVPDKLLPYLPIIEAKNGK